MNRTDIEAFVALLAQHPPGVNSANPFDDSEPGNAVRRRNLERYLEQLAERRPSTLLLGEAPGYRGMRITGIPFTNTTILRDGVAHFGMFGLDNGYAIPRSEHLAPVAAEPTATVMWSVLVELDFLPLLWSAFPLHPHRPGNPRTNRTPTLTEAASWSWAWRTLMELFSIQSVVAVGNVASAALRKNAVSGVPLVRHPAHGGKAKFTLGLRQLLAEGVIA